LQIRDITRSGVRSACSGRTSARTSSRPVTSRSGRRRTWSYVEALLAPRLEVVEADSGYRTVRAAAELMRAREHLTLAPVAERLAVSPRTLQRLFARYVGASPLWVLRRYRLQDAAAAIDAGEGTDLAALASDLGFADQAHFTRSFTQVIGVPPSVYRRARDAPVQ
jgi:transcriptional regulator GlxA family with amidase domain